MRSKFLIRINLFRNVRFYCETIRSRSLKEAELHPNSLWKNVIMFGMLFLGTTAFSQTDGDYRSNAAAGTWGALGTWQRYTTGTGWAAPTAVEGYPGQFSASTLTTILGGHAITLNAGLPGSILSATTGSIITGAGQLTLGDNVTVNATGAGTNGAVISCPLSLGGTTRIFTVVDDGTTATDLTISGVVSGSAFGVTKAGSGTMTLSGVNTYTGVTTINAGILQLGASGVIANASPINMNGGALKTGATTGFPETIGTLTLSENSTIALGTGIHSLNFAHSSAVVWTPGKQLTITGWQGAYTGLLPGTGGRIIVNNTILPPALGLTASQLQQIRFYNGSAYIPATIVLTSGEIVPQLSLITTNAITGSPFCAGSILSVQFAVLGTVILNPLNVFTVQLSDASGSFASLQNIGTLVSQTVGTVGTITATIPVGTPAGTGYRIRVVALGLPVDISTVSDNGTNLTINAVPTFTTTGVVTAVCQSAAPQNATLVYTAATNAPTSYSIDWNVAANSAGLADQTITPFAFAAGGGNITTIVIAANTQPGNHSGTMTITDANGCTNTQAVTITVNALPTIATTGTVTAVCPSTGNQVATLVYTATTNAPTSYSIDWNVAANTAGLADQVNTAFAFTAGGGSLTTVAITANTPAGNYSGTMTIRNDNGCTNAQAVTVTVNAPPSITGQPSASVVCEGDNAAFTVAASGAGLTYRWQFSTNGGSIFNDVPDGGIYSNVTEATMNITAAARAMNTYQYRCVVSGICPPLVTSNAVTLNVNSDSGGISINGGAPTATNGSVFYCASNTAVFSVASVTGATSYTWVVPPSTDWAIVSGQGTRTVTVTTGTSAQSGNVSVTADTFCPSHIGVTLTSVAPNATTITKINPTCITPTGTVTAAPPSPAVTGTLTYTLIKTSVSPEVIVGQNATGVFTGLDGGDYVVAYQINSGCYSGRSNSKTIVPLVTNRWNGIDSGWSGGTPSLNHLVVFDADYSKLESVNACSCVVSSGKDVTIKSGFVLNIINDLKVLGIGTLTFENDASLVQLNNTAPNSGSITYNRTTPLLKDLDYEYWSSPVAGQTLGNLWTSDRYFKYTNGAWEAQDGSVTMGVGRGYIIRVRTGAPFQQSVVFRGAPNNGIKTIDAQGANKSNLIGNPYPSAIDAEAFMRNNSIVGSALYFWTHHTARQLDSTGTKYYYIADDYAVFNLTGGGATVPTAAAPSTLGSGVVPSGKIAAGQAFFVISNQVGKFTFNNSMRFNYVGGGIVSNSQFFKPSDTEKSEKIEKDRVWLNLTNEGGAFKQLLVGYVTGATNDFDKLYDGVSRNSNAYIDFYSISNSKNYTIQGRGLPFDKADEVPLGYKSIIAGKFNISIDNADGGLADQTIYLEDKVTNTIHDLKAGSYSFTTATGVFNDRFVMRYTNTSKLGTGNVEANGKGVFVSVRNRQIKINSFDQTMTAVKVFDMKGSLLYEKHKIIKNEFIIDALTAGDQFMIVMVQLEEGKWLSEEIIFRD